MTRPTRPSNSPRRMAQKTDLTPDEKLLCAVAYLLEDVSQQVLAMLYRVNSGRVNEAIMEVREAIGWDRDQRRGGESGNVLQLTSRVGRDD